MTVAPAPDRRRLYFRAAVGLACVAIVVVGLWMAAGLAGSHRSATSGDRLAQATVTASASCQGGGTQDSVRFTLDGVAHQARLDGCGQQRGEVVQVLVPSDVTADTVLEPTDSAPGDASGLSHRVAFLLLIVAAVVGGAFGYRFFRTRGDTGAEDVRRARQARRTQQEADMPDPDDDYHSDIRPVARDFDPEATGVDWFEDSAADLKPVEPPADLSQRADGH